MQKVLWSKIDQMNTKEFHERFPDEASCRHYWRNKRELAGIVCKRCEGTDHYWHSGKLEWRCKECRSSTSLRSGTVMQDSNLPFLIWFTAMFEMIYRKKSLSATEMYSKLDVKSESTAWYLMHKIRRAMGKRDEKYELSGDVEMDDAFVTVIKEMKLKDTGQVERKRGRGSERKISILVMASTQKIKKPKKGRPNSLPKYFKMVVAEELTRDAINETAFCNINSRSKIKTDGYSSFTDLKKFMKKHISTVVPAKQAHIALPWVHTCIGNFKRFVNGILHHVSDVYLQNYLDEFVYKLNRRNFTNPFENIITAGVQNVWG